MTAQNVASTIQLILAPVVMVTACAILAGGLLTRYGVINDRLRAMTRERLDLLRAGANAAQRDPLLGERLTELDAQVPGLMHRHQQARNALLNVYSASLVFIADMFVIALATTAGWAWLPTLVLITFLAGTALLFVGLLLTLLELRSSHEALYYEVRRVTGLGKEPPGPTAN